MFSGQFQTTVDPDIGPNVLSGKVTGLAVLDPTEKPPAGERSMLLETGDPFNIRLRWELFGPSVWVVGGYWHVQAFIASIDGTNPPGCGPLGSSVSIPVAITGDPTKFEYVFTVPGTTITQDGLYQITAVINHTPSGAAATSTSYTEMVGFAESGPVKFTTTLAESN